MVQNDDNNVSEDHTAAMFTSQGQGHLVTTAMGSQSQNGPFKDTSHSIIMTSKVRVNPEVRYIFEDTLKQEEMPETPFFPSFKSSIRSFHGCLKENPASLFT